jgi:hypothetical protein
MKKRLILGFLVLYSITAMAQKSQVKIGGGIGEVPYLGAFGWNIESQYEYQMTTRFSGFIALGMNGDKFTSQGRSQGSDGTGTWDNSWQYQSSERLNYFDAGFKYQIFKIRERYKMKAAVGGSLAQSTLRYPENIFIDKGIIELKEDVTRKVEVGMLLLGIENYISITDRLGISLNLNYRTTFNEKYTLTREVKDPYGVSYSISGILDVVNLSLQVGYKF